MDWSSVEKLSYLYMTWSEIKTTAEKKVARRKERSSQLFLYIFYMYVVGFFSWKSPLTQCFVWILEEGDYFVSFFNS